MALECYRVSGNSRCKKKEFNQPNTLNAFLTQLIADCCTTSGFSVVIGMATVAATKTVVLCNEKRGNFFRSFSTVSNQKKRSHLRDLQIPFLNRFLAQRVSVH